MSARRMWWSSLGRAAIGAVLIIGVLAALASVLEVYFFAILVAVLLFCYRREILPTRAPRPLEIVRESAPVAGPGDSELHPPSD